MRGDGRRFPVGRTLYLLLRFLFTLSIGIFAAAHDKVIHA
jgi:hypothetical protein